MKEIKCDHCDKFVDFAVITENDECYCEDCAEYLDSIYYDQGVDRAMAFASGEYDG